MMGVQMNVVLAYIYIYIYLGGVDVEWGNGDCWSSILIDRAYTEAQKIYYNNVTPLFAT